MIFLKILFVLWFSCSSIRTKRGNPSVPDHLPSVEFPDSVDFGTFFSFSSSFSVFSRKRGKSGGGGKHRIIVALSQRRLRCIQYRPVNKEHLVHYSHTYEQVFKHYIIVIPSLSTLEHRQVHIMVRFRVRLALAPCARFIDPNFSWRINMAPPKKWRWRTFLVGIFSFVGPFHSKLQWCLCYVPTER